VDPNKDPMTLLGAHFIRIQSYYYCCHSWKTNSIQLPFKGYNPKFKFIIKHL